MAAKPTVLYNGGCPVCRTGAEFYQSAGGNDDACGWVDVKATPEALAAHGVTMKAVKYRMHYIDGTGKVLRGAPAIAAILKDDRRFHWLSVLMRLPVLKWIAAAAYEIVAAPLYVWNNWRDGRNARNTKEHALPPD